MAQRNTRAKGVSSQSQSQSQRTPRKKNASGNKNTAANTGRKTNNKQAENITEQNGKDFTENSLAFNIAPFILLVVSIYILVTFFISGAESVGGIGVFTRNIFYGLLGSVAVLVPVFMGSIAFFLKRDIRNGFFRYRLIFSVICLVLYASIFHLAYLPSGEKVEYSGLSEIFENGINSDGGGVFGGYLAETLCKCVGPIGAWIFTLPLSVVFSTFLFGYTPVGAVRLIAKFINEYKTSANGYERNIIVKSPDPERRFKTKTHRYKIASHINMPAQNAVNNRSNRNFQADISIDSPKKNKKPQKAGISISNNPFANSFTEETEKIEEITDLEKNQNTENVNNNNNIELQRSYETPLMLPDTDLFGGGNVGISCNNTDDSNKTADFADLINADADFESDGVFESPAPAENSVIEDIKIVESVPQSRDDEPDIAENNGADKKTINFETSKIFEEETPIKKEYKLPPISYLTKDTSAVNVDISEELNTTAKKLIDTLASFGVRTKIYGVSRGPSITRYEISPDSGTKVNSIVNLVNDISLNLAAEVRIEAPIPGKAAIGVEVPNKIREIVHLRALLEEQKFTNAASKITIALGMDVAGNPIYSDIAKMPHLLIAGATGMGKSICMNSIITSILYKAKPDEVKMILIDPKKVELNIYNGLPHLLVPVVSDPKKAAGSLSWAVNEMENRYMLIEEKGVRDIKTYNESIADDPFCEPLPQIVIIVDELADLMLTAPADVEQSINRLAAKARAAGIHLIVATQRPSVDIITGLIKANIPTRVAFTVTAPQDSRTIINMGGAEKLIGSGDMLYVPTGTKPIRVQGAYVSEKDVLNVVEFWKKQSDGEYDENILNEIEQEAARCNTKGAKIKDKNDEETSADDEFRKDSALKSAIELAIDMGTVSTSLLQRKLSLGYARAARIVDTMEKMGVISQFEGSKPRKVLITKQDFIEMTMNDE